VNTIIRISRKASLKAVIVGKRETRGEIQRQYLSIKKARTIL
jgi:hypothetical protein